MQDLRDKLLKAGLVKKKQARQARTDARRELKKKGGGRSDEQRSREQQQRFEAKQADVRQQARERQVELNRQRAEHEREQRIRDLIQARALVFRPSRPAVVAKGGDRGPQERPFHFLGRDGFIRRVYLDHALAYQLSIGRIAIVEAHHDPHRDFAFVDASTALRLEDLEASRRILFWNKTTADDSSELPTYGAGVGGR